MCVSTFYYVLKGDQYSYLELWDGKRERLERVPKHDFIYGVVHLVVGLSRTLPT